jgi:hypothetical protein
MVPLPRSSLILPLLLAPGCLYIGGLNHAPRIESVEGFDSPRRCGQLTLRAVASDPDGAPVTYRWTITVASTEPAAPGHHGLISGGDGTHFCKDPLFSLSATAAPAVLQGDVLVLQLPARGQYKVRLEAADPDGAFASHEVSFEVPNQPPVISDLALEGDENHVNDKVPDLGNRMPVHAHYRAWVRQVTDPEGDLICGTNAKATWELVEPAEAVPHYFEPVPCKPGEPPGSLLRFRLPQSVAEKGPVNLRLRVSYDDGRGGKVSRELSTPIHPNRPPCIVAADVHPKSGSTVASKPVPVLHEEGLRFDASRVNDDVPQGLSFTWLIRDQGSSSFSVVQGQGPVFVVPPWYRAAGHQLELRVIVEEHELAALACDEELALCPLPESYNPGAALGECYAWLTWRLSFI